MNTLENLHIGFIGLGNMGGAVAEGLVRAGIPADHLYACGGHFEKLTARCQEISKRAQVNMQDIEVPVSEASAEANVSDPSNVSTSDSASNLNAVSTSGIHACQNAADVVDATDLIFIAIKPGKIPSVLKPISAHFENKLVVSVAWGYDFARYEKEEIFPDSTHLLCTIPNTPVSVGKGIFVTEKTTSLTAEEQTLVEALLEKISLVIPVETAQLNIGGIIGGCAPAFAEVFMEALADAAVMYGIPRATAYPLVSKMLEGTAALQLASGKHPAAMKDDVCSPGGATIRGIASMEEHGFRGTVIDAVKAIQGE